MIEFSAQEQAELANQLANRPGRRTRQQSWAPVSLAPDGESGSAAQSTPGESSAPDGEKSGPRVIAVASGKGGVGKSTVAANLAVLAAQRGLKVGVIDADLHGFSLTRLLGIVDKPARVGNEREGLAPNARPKIAPPQVYGLKVISIGMFTDPAKAVIWRGPVAHRALTQFLTDTDWGPLDLLLIDLPPGTGDIALSIANLLPGSELLIVTNPQATTAEVAARAGAMAAQTQQRVIGVVENMAWLETPTGQKVELFGSGGGEQVANSLTGALGYPVELLAQIPIEPEIPTGADQGQPIVIGHPESPAATALQQLADRVLRLTT